MQITSKKVQVDSKVAKEAAYEKWLRGEVQAAIDNPKPGVPHEQVMAKMQNLIKNLMHEKC